MRLLFFILFLSACSQEKYVPAEDALDAAREFKNACLKGNFKKAKFYLAQNQKNNNLLYNISNEYFKNNIDQKKELANASIRIINNKEINSNLYQIVLGNSYNTKVDTLFAVKDNSTWLINSKD